MREFLHPRQLHLQLPKTRYHSKLQWSVLTVKGLESKGPCEQTELFMARHGRAEPAPSQGENSIPVETADETDTNTSRVSVFPTTSSS